MIDEALEHGHRTEPSDHSQGGKNLTSEVNTSRHWRVRAKAKTKKEGSYGMIPPR